MGSYSLYLSISGPPPTSSSSSSTTKTSSKPLIIIEAGHGDSSASWVVVARRIAAASLRVLTYDRSGYGRSQEAPEELELGPMTRAEELGEALKVAVLWGAYADGEGPDAKGPGVVLVGHSYGGTLVRAFLLSTVKPSSDSQYPPLRVAGLVLVDSLTSYEALDPPTSLALLPGAGSSPAEYRKIVGLEEHHVFSAEEYATVVATSDKDEGRGTGGREAVCVVKGTDEVNEALGLGGDDEDGMTKGKLQGNENDDNNAAAGPRAPVMDHSARLGAIFCGAHYDFAKIVQYYKRTGRPEDVSCSDEEFASAVSEVGEWTEMFERVEEGNKRRVLGLAVEGMARFTIAEGIARTHNVQWIDPELIAREALWVVGGREEGGGKRVVS